MKIPIIFCNMKFLLVVFLLPFFHLEAKQYLPIHQRLPGQKYDIGTTLEISSKFEKNMWRSETLSQVASGWLIEFLWAGASPLSCFYCLAVNKKFSRSNFTFLAYIPPKLYQVKIQLGKGLNLNGDKSKTFESVRIRSARLAPSFSLYSFAVVGVVGGTSVVEVLMVVYDILDSWNLFANITFWVSINTVFKAFVN